LSPASSKNTSAFVFSFLLRASTMRL